MAELQDVPQRIRDLFGSVRTTEKIEEISRRADLETPNLLPRLLYLLEIKGVSAHDFIPKMREMLGFGETKARSVARAIKEEILELERGELYGWGVDISFIEVGDAPELPEAPEEASDETGEDDEKASVKTIGGLPIVSRKPAAPPVKVSVEKEQEENEEGEVRIQSAERLNGIEAEPARPAELRPFILHEERAQTAPVAAQIRGFSIPFGFFDAKAKSSDEGRKVPIKAEVWSAGKNIVGKIIKKEPEKTIHYTSARTPVSPFGERDDKIFAPQMGKKSVFSWPDQKTGEEKDRQKKDDGSNVKLRGNTIILDKET